MGTFATAWRAFWRIWGNQELADTWNRLADKSLEPPTEEPAPEAAPSSDASGALHLLGILQREDRLIDFLQEDLGAYSDEQVGTAARKVHDDCQRTLDKYLAIRPVRGEEEGGTVRVEPGFDARELRVTGHATGEPPFTGTLVHRGWQATKVELPQRNAAQKPEILCPAEVEV